MWDLGKHTSSPSWVVRFCLGPHRIADPQLCNTPHFTPRSPIASTFPTPSSSVPAQLCHASVGGRVRYPDRAGTLLGHKDVSTTMVYTYVLQRGGQEVRRPLDPR